MRISTNVNQAIHIQDKIKKYDNSNAITEGCATVIKYKRTRRREKQVGGRIENADGCSGGFRAVIRL
jgi:hypothetical protein